MTIIAHLFVLEEKETDWKIFDVNTHQTACFSSQLALMNVSNFALSAESEKGDPFYVQIDFVLLN